MRRLQLIIAGALMVAAVGIGLVSIAAPVNITIPFSSVAIADSDLDGDPATGDWSDALNVTIPLENGEPDPYGNATLYVKHNGTNLYFRIDGDIDVAWVSSTGDHFWLGFQAGTGNSHHGGGTWDGVFFGLWNGVEYTPEPTYPPPAVDTNDFNRPPPKDTSQDVLGYLTYSGASAPFSFTVEWKRPLSSGDADDLTYVADDTTVYNFFVTTDSDGDGSSGGAIDHRGSTNLNTFKIASVPQQPPVAAFSFSPGNPNVGEAVTFNASASSDPDGNIVSYAWVFGDGNTGSGMVTNNSYATPGTFNVTLTVTDDDGLTDATSQDVPVNAGPTVDLTTPDGGEVWSAGTSHLIYWNMSDTEDPETALKVWLNYSEDNGQNYSPIPGAQGLSGLACPCTFSWTTPVVESANMRVMATVVDTAAVSTNDSSTSVFTLDATAPSVDGTSPSDGAVGVPPTTTVNVTFSESMNAPETEQAFSLRRNDTGAYIPGAFSWSGFVMTFTPTAELAQGVVFIGRVNTTARDASDPGNSLPQVYSFSFTTMDSLPPTIENVTATPPVQESGASVNITASVSDNGVVADVWVEVTDPLSVLLGNYSMNLDVGSGLHYYSAPYQTPGNYSFQVLASDAAGNWNATNGSFQILDTIAPTILHTPPTGAVVGVDIPLEANVSDNNAVFEVRVNYTDVLGTTWNETMVLSGPVYTYTIPAQNQSGTVEYFIWAVDYSANEAKTILYNVTVTSSDTSPPTISNLTVDPPAQDVPLPTNISVAVTDNVAVDAVFLNVSDPTGMTVGNFSMTKLGSSGYYHETSYTLLGDYNFVIWAFDLVGNAASVSGNFSIVDTVAPVLGTPSASPNPQEVYQTVDFSVSVTDNYQVAAVTIAILDPDGVAVGNFTMALVAGNYTYSTSFDKLGTHTFTIWASDTSGNYASATGQLTVQDSTSPLVGTPSATPDPQEVYQMVDFLVNVTDNYQVNLVTIAILDPEGLLVGNFTMALVAGNYTYSTSFDKLGTHTFTIWASDTSGNYASVGGQFVIQDTTFPVLGTPSASPNPQEVYQTVDFSVSVTDNYQVAAVTIAILDPDGVAVGNFTMALVAGNYTYSTSFDKLGTHTFTIWASDTSGNYASAAGQFIVEDTTSPVLGTPSASPSPQEVYQTIDFSVSVTDNYQVAAVTIAIVDPDGVSVGNFTMTLAAGNYTYSTSFDKLGTHAFTIWAGDTSGNYASVGGQFVIQDTTAPIAIATGGGTYEIGEEVVFDASRSTDNTEIANVSWTFLYQGSEVVLYGSTVSFTFETTGEYTVYLLLVDIVGLTASEVLIVLIVDTTPPSSPSIESALPFGDGCLVVTWATVDDRDLAGYRLSRWNASSNAFEEVAELSAEVSSYRDCGLEPDKVYTYRLTAFDGAGNESPHSFMVNGRTEGTREEAFNLIPYLVSIGALVILVSVLAFLAIRPRRPPGQMSQREATGYRPRR